VIVEPVRTEPHQPRGATDPDRGRHDAVALERVTRTFGGVVALDEVSLGIRRGRITGIIGPNGAGKSTVFNVVAGVVRPERGRVLLDGREITGWPPHRVAAAGLVRTFQIARELGRLSVLENLLLARRAQPGEAAWRALLAPAAVRRAEAAAIEDARALLERVGLWQLADAPAGSLSGGQKKLLELARALMTGAGIILLDEPAAGVSPMLMDALAAFIHELQGDGLTLAIIEHDLDVVAALCDPVYVLAGGQVIAEGTFAEVTADARVVDAYLGGL